MVIAVVVAIDVIQLMVMVMMALRKPP